MKTSKRWRTINAIAVLLLAFAAHVAISQAAPAPLVGKLRTRENKPITVNLNKVNSGTTIYSGSEIQTPDKIGATIDLGKLGRVDVAPQTSFKLTFADGKISVELSSGYVVLTTNKGVEGTINAEGKTVQTDGSKISSVIGRTSGAVGPETSGVLVGAAAGGLGTAGTIGAVGAAGAATAGTRAAVKGSSRGQSVSAANPNRQ